MAKHSVSFFVLVSGELVQAFDVDTYWTVVSLLLKIKDPKYGPSANVKRMKRQLCNFYILKNPIEINDDLPDTSEIMAKLHNTDEYTKVGHSRVLKNIAPNFIGNFLYLVIEDLSERADEVVAKLKQGHADLYRCLEFKMNRIRESHPKCCIWKIN
ncbi:hypothetical protein GALMADRAFT_756707 [Galerina marginata CBS 339.88]|uniref:Uncharacterized protein n=1 Tax=Galerina marginata (strain CBS 339.88) TaxID=685588 RepID=A0A067SRF0_GALM3|nr:hypothetical protein GALMADRAFT_756707 [Galerina marginata CBS 339.88]